MKKWIIIALLLTAVCLLGKYGYAESFAAWLEVDHDDGTFANAYCNVDHSNDITWVADSDYLLVPSIALDGGMKFSSYGPSNNKWTAFIWAGNQMTEGSQYQITFHTLIDVSLRIANTVNQQVLASNSFQWTELAVPATTSQWRTQGVRVEISPVPEPSSLLGFSILIGAFIFKRLRH